MVKKNYIIFFLNIFSLIFFYFYFYDIGSYSMKDTIMIIDSNLGDYRIIPEDTGGLTIYDLNILNE